MPFLFPGVQFEPQAWTLFSSDPSSVVCSQKKPLSNDKGFFIFAPPIIHSCNTISSFEDSFMLKLE